MDQPNPETPIRFNPFSAPMPSTGVPSRFSIALSSNGNSSAASTPDLQLAALGHSPGPMLLGGPMETGGFSSFPGDGTIHISCLVAAPHELLMRSQNAAYIAAMQKIEGLSRHIQHLEGELGAQKQAFDSMVSKMPILLGMAGTENHSADDPLVAGQQGADRSSTGKVVLGLGMVYPVAPDAPPPGVHIKFWSKKNFSGRTIRQLSKKSGQHKSDKNIGQVWIEDEMGNTIPGYVAQSIREILASCFHSLAWTGQAPLQSRDLGHEARVYIHNILGRQFPFLLNCEGGRWKINELITQAYSGFVGTHLKKKGTNTTKRARSDSTTSDSDSDSEAPRVKAPKHASESQSSHEIPSPPSLQPSSTPPSDSPSHPLLDPNVVLFTIGGHEDANIGSGSAVAGEPVASAVDTTPALSSSLQYTPSTDVPITPNTSTTSGYEAVEPLHHRDLTSGDPQHMETPASLLEPMSNLMNASPPEALAHDVSHPSASILPTTPTPDAPRVEIRQQIPIPKPFAVTTRSRTSTVQLGQPEPDSESEAPTRTVPQTATPSPPTTDTPPPLQDGSTDSADVTPSAPATVATAQQGRRRGPVKATDKYNPNTISIQSFHMRDQINTNPNILHTEWKRLFTALDPVQRKAYQDEVTKANRERKGKGRAG